MSECSVQRIAGRAVAARSVAIYLLTCETLTGEEAERIELVSLCVIDEGVQDHALRRVRWKEARVDALVHHSLQVA